MIALIAVAWAAPEGSSDTTVQARTDMLGELYVASRETLGARVALGPAFVEGYGELGWSAGFDQDLQGELFVLAADGSVGGLDWTLGRQRIDLPAFGRMLDGGRIGWSPASNLHIEAWAGYARHVGLDGLTAGAPVARLAGSYTRGPLATTLGAWGELGDSPAFHPDLRLHVRDSKSRLAPDVNLLAAAGFGKGGATFERGRIEASLRPLGGVRALVWGEHREALPGGSVLGPSILASFAPGGAEEIGAGVGWTDMRRSQLWAEGAVQVYTTERGTSEQGVSAELAWRPTCPSQTWCAYPSWRGATGPGGVYNALATTVIVPVPDPATLSVYGMVVPYRKPYLAWDTALALGSTLSIHPPASSFTMVIGGEVARTAIAPVDPRGWATLRIEPQLESR